jgi:RNA polymerase sigma factor (sigma-70 family)
MEAASKGSVTCWITELKAGRDVAAQELWNRYFTQLVQLARHRLQGMAREADEEDIALSALKSAMIGVKNSRFPDLSDREGLWPLLVTITARKAMNEIKRQRAKKRHRDVEAMAEDVDWIVGNEPSPAFALQLTEALDALVVTLGDDSLRKIALHKLEGLTDEEIAAKLDVSRRTIVRKLQRIRQEWQEWRF